jgi:glycosyltransferase involved in cell wall biosynthesis
MSDRVQTLIRNDKAVLEALDGRPEIALSLLREAFHTDPSCELIRLNMEILSAEPSVDSSAESVSHNIGAVAWADLVSFQKARNEQEKQRNDHCDDERPPEGMARLQIASAERNRGIRSGARPLGTGPDKGRSRTRVAIVSLLFNWPSTGGGNIHTVELGRFLAEAGLEVHHVFARYPTWGIGRVSGSPLVHGEGLEFSEADWNLPTIRERFRRAINAFAPDCVVITDSWNMKPFLAEAARGYPYFLRFQALECLCPLNNLRLLADGPEQVEQCPRHQLATADHCHRCVGERGRHSGQLHQAERALAGVGTPEYDRALRRALEEAEAALVLNPLTEALLSPYARRVWVVPWGMDPARFPWPPPEESPAPFPDAPVTLFMAAVAGEFIKGFHILHEACRRLRRSRTDFELVVTFDPPGRMDEFTRSVGWVSQEDLPCHYRAADVCVVPTVAQEGLSRTSVEAMASGLPVVASRIGGLPYTVSDGATGLLFEPGDPDDLARKIATLLDDPPLRRRMGLEGRRRFERQFTWPTVIEKYYSPLFEEIRHRGAGTAG